MNSVWAGEYWVGRNEIQFYMCGTDRKLKSRHHPLLIPNIPFLHHSTNPMVNLQHETLLLGEIKDWSSGLGFLIGA